METEKDWLYQHGCEKDTMRYLGDGAYAGYNGHMIWLVCRRENGFHYIALEPQPFLSLARFAQNYNYVELKEDS